MDLKDHQILKELDSNYRQSFSDIAKKVKLSKNSVILRYEKLKKYVLHNATGINNEILGYTTVKIFYTFDFYNEKLEKEIIDLVKNSKNIIWAARYYGSYDLCLFLFTNDLSTLITEINKFNKKFSDKIAKKEIQIIYKQYIFRNNFLYDQQVFKDYSLGKTEKIIEISKKEKEILKLLRYNPRISIIDISKKLNITEKTVSKLIKKMEKEFIITGYFMTVDTAKFGFSVFKLLLQVQKIKNQDEFENYIRSIKNVKYFTKMLGLW
ncbi:Lrp/AsnC family transcriptional regulator, partial [Candidatus Woesearchaeota archaeon]|nr:Lrp/AsnC family transcriptional regulator [Candidatus Woesearchaeota archaeon]